MTSKAIKEAVDLPVIGIIKRDYDDADVFITATMKEIDELMTVKPEIIALDATTSTRPNGQTLMISIRKLSKISRSITDGRLFYGRRNDSC